MYGDSTQLAGLSGPDAKSAEAESPGFMPVGRLPRLWTDHLSVHFEDRSALENVSLQFFPGATTSLVGPNGAGKSTLLKCLAGMIPATHGAVFRDGVLVRQPSHRTVYVPQRSDVDWRFPISVLDVTLMSRALSANRLQRIPAVDRRAALSALDAVGMSRFAAVQIGALSGGQQQRVFIARAALQNADVLLLDEPFSGVDAPTQSLVLEMLAKLRQEGTTIIFATHDLAMARESADSCVLLNRQVIASGSPSAALTVPNLEATFGGRATFAPASVSRL